MYDYIRYFNPNWVILNDAANKNPWKRFSEFATPDSSITPFSQEELIDNRYLKILHIGEVGQEENSYIILASKLYWREGILNSFLKKAYIWGGDQDLWIYYGGTVDANGDWRISPFLLEQLNSVNEKPLKVDNPTRVPIYVNIFNTTDIKNQNTNKTHLENKNTNTVPIKDKDKNTTNSNIIFTFYTYINCYNNNRKKI